MIRQDRPQESVGRIEEMLGHAWPTKKMYRCARPEQARHDSIKLMGYNRLKLVLPTNQEGCGSRE